MNTPYEKKDFTRLVGTPGFSDALLNNHFKLYEGYITNVNKLSEKLNAIEIGTPEYAELKRRFGWEWNGMFLHELYFGNMKKEESVPGETLRAAIEKSFGSWEKWEKDFRGTGALRGIGWAILAKDNQTGNLFNVWINEHDGGHLAGATPLLVMDVFEHAFILDYGVNRADYIGAFWKAIDWETVSGRLS